MWPFKHCKLLVGWAIGIFLLANVAYMWTVHGPRISSASVDPVKVRPGDMMQISAKISDPSGVSQVSAQMPHEIGSDLLNLSLFSGTVYNGSWRGSWRVHDTLAKNYTTKLTATNFLGAQSFYYINWSDPPAWYSSSWSYRRNITLSPATPVANYQVKVDLTAANFNYARLSYPATGQDIRFTGSDGTTPQDYWIESWVNGGTSTIWVEAAASGTSTLYMYYGNPAAASASNGTNTFEIFDDFNDNSLDATKWSKTDAYGMTVVESGGELKISGTATGGGADDGRMGYLKSVSTFSSVSLDAKMRNQDGSVDAYAGILQFWAAAGSYSTFGFFRNWAGWNYLGYYNPNAWYGGDLFDATVPDGIFHTYSFRRIGTSLELWRDGVQKTTKTNANLGTGNINILLAAFGRLPGDTGDARFEDVRVRKYASSEPSVLSVGAEEDMPILLSVSNNAPVPIKGGNSFNVTPSGQNDLQSHNLYFYCRLDSAGATSANTNCTQGNAAYSAPYSTMLCTVSAPVDTASHTYYCRVYDGVFYSSESNTSITADSSPPNTGTISVTSTGASGYVNATTPIFSLSTSDVGSAGMGQMEFSCDNSSWASPVSYATSYSSFNVKSGSNGCGAVDGSRAVYVRFRDSVGNVQNATVNTSFVLDTSPPATGSISITPTGAPGFVNTTTPTLSLSSSDTNLGYMQFSCDNVSYSSFVSYAGSYSSFNLNSGEGCAAGDGSKTVYVRFKDRAGNVQPGVNFTSVVLDTTLPALSFVLPSDANNSIIGSGIRNWSFVNVSLTEQNRDTIKLFWSGAGELLPCSGSAPNWTCAVNKTDLNLGTYSYYAWANDSAGNVLQGGGRGF